MLLMNCRRNNNNRIDSLRQICTIIRAICLPNKEVEEIKTKQITIKLRGYSTQTHFFIIIEILFTIYINICVPIVN